MPDKLQSLSASVDLVFRPKRNPLKTVNPKGLSPTAIPCSAAQRSVSTWRAAPPQQETQVVVSHTHVPVDTAGARIATLPSLGHVAPATGDAQRYSQCPVKVGTAR